MTCDTKRISITLSKEEYNRWISFNYDGNLSKFIRDAVNEYIKIQKPENQQTVFDLFLNQQIELKKIKDKLDHLDKIEGDLIDITAALAKFDMIDIYEDQWEIKKKKTD